MECVHVFGNVVRKERRQVAAKWMELKEGMLVCT